MIRTNSNRSTGHARLRGQCLDPGNALLKALLFDVDGTIAETEEAHRQAFNEAFAFHGIDVHWSRERYRELLRTTGGKERILADFASRGEEIDVALVVSLHKRKNAIYASHVLEGRVPLRPGVLHLMDEARAGGLKLGVATTTSRANVEVLFDSTLGPQWRDWFSCCIAGDEVARKKPAPDVYLAALAALGLEGGEALAIEDSAAGVASARAAGLAVVATPSAYTQDEDFGAATIVLADLGGAGLDQLRFSQTGGLRTC